MQRMNKAIDWFLMKISIIYIEFVYKTSKVKKKGDINLINNSEEKFIIGFWHGDSYCFYPIIKGTHIYIITTSNRRGDYISNICHQFGYSPLRLPDESVGGNFLFKIRKTIKQTNDNLALTLDGPLGPYHEPKKLGLMMARISKRRLLPVSIRVKRKIQIKSRWDKFTIPLPFNQIEVFFHEPIEVLNHDINSLQRLVKKEMEDK